LDTIHQYKDEFFKKSGSGFHWQKSGVFRDPAEWAKAKFFKLSASKLSNGFFCFTKSPIHLSLTKLEPAAAKEAAKMFKSVLGFLGLKKNPSAPELLGFEIISHLLKEQGQEWASLRDECMCQLMKQITECPSEATSLAAWRLLFLCCDAYPASGPFFVCVCSMVVIFVRACEW
jgi:hypothetical protein